MLDIKDRIKNSINIVDVIGSYVDLKKVGRRFRGICPFHPDSVPSFYVDPDRQFFHCFGCRTGGDVFSFIQKLNNISFPDALQELARIAGIDVDIDVSTNKTDTIVDKIREKALGFFISNRNNSFYSYLQDRGITLAIADQYELGYAHPGCRLYNYLKKKCGFHDHDILRSHVCVKRGNKIVDFLYDRIVFPVRNIQGKLTGFVGRTIRNATPKYVNTSYEKASVLYGLHQNRNRIRQTKYVYITEGYLDVLTAVQSGISNVACVGGVAFSLHHAVLIKKLCPNIVFVMDSDKAGISSMKRAICTAYQAGIDGVKVCVLPEGEDLDSFIKKYNVQEEKGLWPYIMDITEFYLHYSADYRGLKEAIDSIVSSEKRSEMIIKICSLTGLPQEFFSSDKFQSYGEDSSDIDKADVGLTGLQLIFLVTVRLLAQGKELEGYDLNELYDLFDETEQEIIKKVKIARKPCDLYNILSENEQSYLSGLEMNLEYDAEDIILNNKNIVRNIINRHVRQKQRGGSCGISIHRY